jgi:DNA-binding XRE family transcriptional regulator
MHIGDRQSQDRLAKAVKDRRSELKLRQQDLSARGGPSKASLYNIENSAADNYSDTTIEMLETSLDWAFGSVAAIIAGQNPTPLPVDPEDGEAAGDEIEITYRGWLMTLRPSPDATREQVRRIRREALNTVMDRIDDLDLPEPE